MNKIIRMIIAALGWDFLLSYQHIDTMLVSLDARPETT